MFIVSFLVPSQVVIKINGKPSCQNTNGYKWKENERNWVILRSLSWTTWFAAPSSQIGLH